jgi:hypothetical protein
MPRVERVLAIGQYDDRRGELVQPAYEVAQEIQGGVVGPVHVLDDQHGRPGELGQDRVERQLRVIRRERLLERPRSTAERVPQRLQGWWRQEVVAGADQDPDLGPDRARQLPDQTGLADTGLAGHQDGGTLPVPCRLDDVEQVLDLVVPFDKLNR